MSSAIMNTIIGLGVLFAFLSIPFGIVIVRIGNSVKIRGYEFVTWPAYSVFGIFTLFSVVAWVIGISFWQWGIVFFVFLCALPGVLIGAEMAHTRQKDKNVLGLLDSLEKMSEQQKLRSAENAKHTTN